MTTLKRNKRGQFVRRSTADKARAMVASGRSMSETAKALGVRFQQVRNAVVTTKVS